MIEPTSNDPLAGVCAGDYAKGLASCIRTIGLAQPNNRLAVFQNMANDAGGYVRKGGIGVLEFADRFQEAAVNYGLVDAHGQDAIEAILADALKEPIALNGDAFEFDHRPARPNGQRPENGNGAAAVLVSRCAAEIIPEKIAWLWPNRLALGKHTCIAGEPGTGILKARFDPKCDLAAVTPLHRRPDPVPKSRRRHVERAAKS